MRFFTPELYLQFNSDDDAEADRANAVWEEAVEQYRRHLKSLAKQMPAAVKSLAKLCLHDLELLSFQQQPEASSAPRAKREHASPQWSGAALLCLRDGDDVHTLMYVLCGPVRQQASPRNWPFSNERRHWLYDEIDAGRRPAGSFLHRILFSDGSILEIPFSMVFVDRFALPSNGSRQRPRKRAS